MCVGGWTHGVKWRGEYKETTWDRACVCEVLRMCTKVGPGVSGSRADALIGFGSDPRPPGKLCLHAACAGVLGQLWQQVKQQHDKHETCRPQGRQQLRQRRGDPTSSSRLTPAPPAAHSIPVHMASRHTRDRSRVQHTRAPGPVWRSSSGSNRCRRSRRSGCSRLQPQPPAQLVDKQHPSTGCRQQQQGSSCTADALSSSRQC